MSWINFVSNLLALFALVCSDAKLEEIDKDGYILYCPCMGRFGNQADQFIGALAFAKGLDRTLVLPPWITYPSDQPFNSLQIAFEDWFQVEPLKKYYPKVMTMDHFMSELASRVWPAGRRKGFCYRFGEDKKTCSMKNGNPFGPFWDHFDVNFDGYVEHSGLLWDSLDDEETRNGWLTRFPASEYPVIAFQGAPGSFPSTPATQHIQKYIEFSQKILLLADEFIREEMKGKRFVAIHLRNGIDLTRVCDELDRYSSLFASAQCTKHATKNGVTKLMCNPTKAEIIKRVKQYVRLANAEAVFVATDNDAMMDTFRKELKRMKVTIHKRKPRNEVSDPIVDIALLSKADFFIGNCVSTFSAFVRRHRETRNLPIGFFGIEYPQKIKHEDL